MTQQIFEARLLNLWMTTRVPLTRANLLFYTKAPRKRMSAWLDELVGDGVLEVDADPDGEMLWAVRGAKRPDSGAERIEDAGAPPADSGDLSARLERIKKDALARVGAGTGLQLMGQARSMLKPKKEGDKSLLVSGLLSFFFGPLGWLYAAPFKVAIPAAIITIIIVKLFGWALLGPLAIIFSLVGVAYAWRHNQHGERAPLLGGGDSADEKPPALPRKRT